MPHTIRCRAQVADGCLDGEPTSRQFGDPDEDLPMSEDGTWEVDDGVETIVCDPCYVALMPLTPSGAGLRDELPAAIAKAKATS